MFRNKWFFLEFFVYIEVFFFCENIVKFGVSYWEFIVGGSNILISIYWMRKENNDELYVFY